MAAAAAIPKSRDWKVRGKTLTNYSRRLNFAVLPDGIEAIDDHAFDEWPSSGHFRPRVVFPESFKRLTWGQLQGLGDVQADLPNGFLRLNGGGELEAASRPLGDGWLDQQVTLGSAARAYLLKEPAEAALAQSIIQPEDAATAAEMMVHVLRARAEHSKKKIPRSVLLRAVIFFIRYVKEIAPDTATALVRLLPNGQRESMRSAGPLLGSIRAYHPALLDFVLTAAKIDPNHSAFKGRIGIDPTGKQAVPAIAVKSAIAPYVAACLDVAVHEGASKWLPWVKISDTADTYANQILELDDVVDAVVPGLWNSRAKPETFACAAVVERFGSPRARARIESYLAEIDPNTKRAKQIFTGVALGTRLPEVDELANVGGYYLQNRYLEAVIERPELMMPLDVSGYKGDERQAVRTVDISKKKQWEIVAGPDMQIRWREAGERKLHSIKELPESSAEGAMHASSIIYYTDFFMRALKQHMDSQLEALYLSGASVPASTMDHMARDLTLQQAVCGVVWEQDGKTFTITAGGPVDADGSSVTLSDSPAYMGYAPKMDPEDVQAWKKYFQSKPYDSWMGQMEEPDYSEQTISKDRIANIVIKDTDMRRKKMMSVLSAHQGTIYTPTSSINMRFYRRTGRIVGGDISVDEVNRITNRVLFQLDMITMDERVRRDDPSILPFLERAPISVLRKARKAALDSNAAHVKAAILTMMDDHGDKHAKDRFSLALR